MNVKKILKRIAILLLISLCVSCHSISLYAADGGIDFSWGSIWNAGKAFLEKGSAGGEYIKDLDMQPLVTGLGSILTTIGGVIVLVGILVIGIQYMMATPEEAAKLKTKLIGLVVAGVVILGAWGIWNLTLTFLSGIAQ